MSEIQKCDGDIFWDTENTENSVDDPDDFMEEVGCGIIVEFEAAKRLPNMYGVKIYNADADKYEIHYFETKAEAEMLLSGAETK